MGLGLGFALIALAACIFFRALSIGHHQLVAPFGLGPVESANLEIIQVIRGGANPYSPEVYAAPPFVFTMYTPLYHYLVALLPMPDANPFLWGRIVAAGAMLLLGLLPFLVAGRSGLLVACVAVGVFFALAPVVQRTVFVRNDSLGLLLTALSVLVVHRAEGRTPWLAAAVGLSILAVFTKQSFLAAPIAIGIYLLVSDRSSLYRFLVAGLGSSVAIVAGAQLAWGGGFWFSTILAPRHPILMEKGLAVTRLMLQEPLAIALLTIGLFLAWREWRVRGRAAWTESPFPIYVLISFLLLVATVGKVGSGTNYFLEPILAMLLWMTHVLKDTPRPYRRSPTLVVLAAGLVAAGALELALVARPICRWADPVRAESRQRQLEHVRSDIEALGVERPRVLGLADHPGLYRQADRVQLSLPIFYYWLWHGGLLEIGEMAERIAGQEFDVIVVPRRWIDSERRGFSRFPLGMFPPRMEGPWKLVDAVLESYRVGASRGATHYFVPKTAATMPGDSSSRRSPFGSLQPKG
jgi:hypothetical protein